MKGYINTVQPERSGLRIATSALLLAAAAAALILRTDEFVGMARAVVWDSGTEFFKGFAMRPGGILEYVGLFLTRTLLTPPLGIALLLAIFTTTCMLSRQAAGPDSLVAMFPAVCIMIFLTGPHFGLQGGLDSGWIFSMPLGCLAAVAVIFWFRNSRVPWLYAAIVAFVGFYLFGAYGLMAAIAIALMAFWTRLVYTSAIALFLALSIPFVYSKIPHPEPLRGHAWMGGLPLVVCLVCLATLVLVALCSMWKKRPAAKPALSFAVSALLSAAMVVLAIITH